MKHQKLIVSFGGLLTGLAAVCGYADAVEITAAPQRVALQSGWIDATPRLGGTAAFDGGPQILTLRFDLSEMPVGSQVEKAELLLRAGDPLDWGKEGRDGVLKLGIFPINRYWNKFTKTLFTLPGVIDAEPELQADWRFDWQQPLVLDVTGLVKAWRDGSRNNFGLLLQGLPDDQGKPEADMFLVPEAKLRIVGSGGTAADWTLDAVVQSPEPAGGEAAYLFPDGSRVAADALPGRLISGNRGVWGSYQQPSGALVAFTQPVFQSDSSIGKAADAIVDGNLETGLVMPARSEDAMAVWKFPAAADFAEIDIEAAAPFNGMPFELTFFTSDNGQDWRKLRSFVQHGRGKQFYRIALPEGSRGSYFAMANTGKAALEVFETLLWGEAEYRRPEGPTGILPQVASLGKQKCAVPVLDRKFSVGQFDPEALKEFGVFKMTELNSDAVDLETNAYMALGADGLYIVFENMEPAFDRLARPQGSWQDDLVEVYINRFDLDQRRYYHFGLTSDGKVLLDTSAVIDPVKGEGKFEPECGVIRQEDRWYGILRIPLAAMCEKGDFEAFRWPINLARHHRYGDTDRISCYPAVPELHVPMLFAVLEAEQHELTPETYFSFPLLKDSSFSRETLERWRKRLGGLADAEVIAAPTPMESEWITAPVLPTADLNASRQVTMVPDEVENIAYTLTNPSPDAARQLTLSFSGFVADDGKPAPELQAELGVAGVVQRRRGVAVRPLFLESNFPGSGLLRQYVLNAAEIEQFPTLTLRPGGSEIVTLRVRSAAAKPGKYTGTLQAGGVSLPITVEVCDIALERPEDYCYNNWSSPTGQSSVLRSTVYEDNEAQYWLDSGINIVQTNPLEHPEKVRALEKKIPDLKYLFVVSSKYAHLGYTASLPAADFNEEHKAEIRSLVGDIRDKMLAAGYRKDQFFLELWDEPGVGPGTDLMREIMKTIKEFDPELNLYADPCCWGGNGFRSEEDIYNQFKGWYNEYVDLSVPIEGIYFGFNGKDYPKLRELWDAPRRFNSFYIHPCPGRIMPWKSFKAGLDGWGYYSYFAPREDAWNDLDSGEMDYEVVYPGITGPVITIESEQMREGFEDYLLLYALRRAGRTAELETVLASLENPDVLNRSASSSVFEARRQFLLDALR